MDIYHVIFFFTTRKSVYTKTKKIKRSEWNRKRERENRADRKQRKKSRTRDERKKVDEEKSSAPRPRK